MRARNWLLILVLAVLAGCVSSTPPRSGAVLIFSHTTGYRHDSIGPGVAALRSLIEQQGRTAVASEDPSLFSPSGLRPFAAIVLLSTTTDPKRPESEWLVGERRDALQAFVRSGGAVVAVHAAADSHYHWPWYGKLIGGRFQRHPPGAPLGTLNVTDNNHHSTQDLPPRFSRADEWYYFDDFDPQVRLLVTLDSRSIGDSGVDPNPVSWAHTVEGGRVFYTSMGHTAESYGDPLFLRHLAGGLRWALASRRRPSSASFSPSSSHTRAR